MGIQHGLSLGQARLQKGETSESLLTLLRVSPFLRNEPLAEVALPFSGPISLWRSQCTSRFLMLWQRNSPP